MITKASPVSANVSLDALAAKYHTTSDVLCADITKHNKRYGTTKIELYGNNTQVNSREEAQHPGIFYDREKKEFTLSEIAIYLGKDRKDIVSNIRDYNDPHRPNSKGEQLIPARFKRVGLNSDPVYHIDTIARYFYVFSKAGERDLSFQVMQNYVHALNLQLSKYAVQEQEKGSIVVSDDVSFDDDSSEGSKRTWTAVEKYASIDEQPGLTVNQITSSVGLRRYMVVHRLKRLGAKPLDEKLGPSYMYEKNIIAQVKNYVEPEKQTVPKKEMPTYASVDEQPGLTLEQMAGSLHLSLSVVAKRLNRLGADSLAQRLGRRSMYARDYLEQIRTYIHTTTS